MKRQYENRADDTGDVVRTGTIGDLRAYEMGRTHAAYGWSKGCQDWWPATASEAYIDGWESYHAGK